MPFYRYSLCVCLLFCITVYGFVGANINCETTTNEHQKNCAHFYLATNETYRFYRTIQYNTIRWKCVYADERWKYAKREAATLTRYVSCHHHDLPSPNIIICRIFFFPPMYTAEHCASNALSWWHWLLFHHCCLLCSIFFRWNKKILSNLAWLFFPVLFILFSILLCLPFPLMPR